MIVSQFNVSAHPQSDRLSCYHVFLTNLGVESYSFALIVRTKDSNFHQKVNVHAVPGPALGFHPAGSDTYRTVKLTLARRETVQVRFLPWPIDGQNVDAFGFAELRLPALSQGFGDTPVAQSAEPVPVLVHAFHEIRRKSNPERIEYHAISLASGRAENEVTPDKPLVFATGNIELEDIVGVTQSRQDEIDANMRDPEMALAQMLTVLGAVRDRDELRDLNRLLREAKLPLEIRPKRADGKENRNKDKKHKKR